MARNGGHMDRSQAMNILAGIIAAVIIMTLVMIVLKVSCSRRRRRRRQEQVGKRTANSPVKVESPQLCDSSEEKNPDVIPQGKKYEAAASKAFSISTLSA